MSKTYLRQLCLCMLLFLLPSVGFAQAKPFRLIDKIFSDTASVEKSKWVAYPTLSFSPETSWEFGAAAVLVYFARRDTTNRLSEASGFTFFTVEGQFGAHLDHTLYSHQNLWFALGEIRLQNYPLLYYGIGPDVPNEELGIANADFTLIRERFLRKVHGDWYMGLEVDFQRLSQVSFDWHDSAPPIESILGADGYSNLGLGLGLVYDTRHNPLNVRHGFLSEIAYLHYEPSWGSTHRLNSIFLDSRAFFKVNKRNVLALQLMGSFSEGEVPFNQLNMVGGETMMRGYYLGKYRDKNLLGFQVEHRWLPFKFSKRIGAAAFASIGSVSPTLKFDKTLWTVGGGPRVLLFPKRDIFTRVDVGLNSEGYGIYLFIGEAF